MLILENHIEEVLRFGRGWFLLLFFFEWELSESIKGVNTIPEIRETLLPNLTCLSNIPDFLKFIIYTPSWIGPKILLSFILRNWDVQDNHGIWRIWKIW